MAERPVLTKRRGRWAHLVARKHHHPNGNNNSSSSRLANMIVLSFHILLLVSTDSYHLSIDFVVLAGEEWTPCNFHEHVVTLIVHGIPLENDSPCHPPPPLPLIPSECGGNLI